MKNFPPNHKVAVMDKSNKPGTIVQFPTGAAYRLHANGAVTRANPKPVRGKAQVKAWKKARRLLPQVDEILRRLPAHDAAACGVGSGGEQRPIQGAG